MRKRSEKVEKIACFQASPGKALDYSSDPDHNRSVITVVGDPEALLEAVTEAVGTARDIIDMNLHKGQHPRMGADVVPFIPIRNTRKMLSLF